MAGPVELRVIIDRKPYYINTAVKVMKHEFCGGVIVDHPDADILNDRLRIIRKKAEQFVNDCIEAGEQVTITSIKERIFASNTRQGFLEWIDEQLEIMQVKQSTLKHYITLRKRLPEFGITRWSDVTVENLYRFDSWLHQFENPNGELVSDAAVYNYHKCLKALLARAVRVGALRASPYYKLKGEFKKGDRQVVDYLTEEEMAAIESLRPVRGSMVERARDLFVFQMYTGLSYSDTQQFDINKYRKIGGNWTFVGQRIKTGTPYISRLLPPAVEVLRKHNWKVPKINNADYNHLLKSIAMAAGIDIPLHSHIARHTFATYMLNNGVRIENVAKMLGHTNIVQTQRYAKVLAQSVNDDFDAIARKWK